VVVKTDDGLTLAGEEWLPSTEARPPAGILLIHSFGHSRATWGDLPGTLAQAGYRVLALDLRGHGTSPSLEGDPERILTDPALAPHDLRAGLVWLRQAPGADASRLAVIGASVGANLACVASGLGLVRTTVALSPHRDRAHQLAGGVPLHMQSILFMAASGDPDREPFARRLALETKPPKEVRIFRGSEHGEALLVGHPEAVGMILDWLHKTL
jgi:dienelactone hydrolase